MINSYSILSCWLYGPENIAFPFVGGCEELAQTVVFANYSATV